MADGGAPKFASLYVGDLHVDVTEANLYEVFNSVGPVGSIRVCRDSVTRRSLGYGYVNFHSVQDAERALDQLNYSSIKGRSCRVMWSQRDPSLRKSGAGNIFVKNLDLNIDNKALYDTFGLFGNILSCKVSSDMSGKSRGYGFVHFETEEAAKDAIEKVNGKKIGDNIVEVATFSQKEKGDGSGNDFTNIYIKNFPSEWDEDKVKELFGPLGPISSSCIMTDARGRKSAFVNYENAPSAKEAVEKLHGKDMRSDDQKAAAPDGQEPEEGQSLYVQRAQTKAERQREFTQKSSGGGSQEKDGVNLYIKNLDESQTESKLRELFEPFGKLTSVAAMLDNDGKCRGFGFVSFSEADEATKAVTEMHLKVVDSKPLYVGLAEKREARQDRLRQRYDGGASKGKGKGGGNMGGGMGQMQGMKGMPMQGMMMPQQGMMMNPMMGKGMNPMMMNPMMGKGGPMMPQMMNPQMMAMMQQKGGMPGMGGPMMGKGGPMPGMMPGMMMGPGGARPPMQPQPMPQAGSGAAGLSASALAAAPPQVQKQMLGEKLFPQISKYNTEYAGKITGMMLEMDNSELLILLESEAQLKNKVDEALRVLETMPK